MIARRRKLTSSEVAHAEAEGLRAGQDWVGENPGEEPPNNPWGWSEALVNGTTPRQRAHYTGCAPDSPAEAEWLSAYDRAAEVAVWSLVTA